MHPQPPLSPEPTSTWQALAVALAELGDAHGGFDRIRLGVAEDGLEVWIGAGPDGAPAGAGDSVYEVSDDLALMRAMPGMKVVIPADFNQAYRAVIECCERLEGPLYLRLGRTPTPAVYTEIPASLGSGVDVLREGSDISIFACGQMVWRVLEAAEALEAEDGVEAEIVNVSIVKPLAGEAVVESLAKTGVGVIAEEHRVAGGLADAVREAVAERHPVPIFVLGTGDELRTSGIADRAREALLLKPIVSRPPIHSGQRSTSVR